jgi:hypothetical protein
VVEGRTKAPPGDPVIKLNMASYSVAQSVDHAIIEPAAMGYKKHVPSPIRAAVRHFFANLTEPVIAVNFLLQLHPGKAAETVGRFGINSTIGIGGLLDVAKTKTFKLPYRVNGFGYTFAYYGVKPGPFLFIPLVGPTTLRDAIGLGLDRMVCRLWSVARCAAPITWPAPSWCARSTTVWPPTKASARPARAATPTLRPRTPTSPSARPRSTSSRGTSTRSPRQPNRRRQAPVRANLRPRLHLTGRSRRPPRRSLLRRQRRLFPLLRPARLRRQTRFLKNRAPDSAKRGRGGLKFANPQPSCPLGIAGPDMGPHILIISVERPEARHWVLSWDGQLNA